MSEQVDEGSVEGGFPPDGSELPPDGGDDVGVLNQSLIDDMFGLFPSVGDEATGISSLYEHKIIPQLRSIALESVIERSTRGLEVALRKVAMDAVEVSLSRIVTTRCQNFMEGVAVPALLAVVKTSWGGPLVIELGAELIYMLVAMTFGGAATRVGAAEGRAFTPIEMRVARRLVDEMVANLATNMSAIAPVTLEFEQFESIPRFVDVGAPHSLALVANLAIRVGEASTGLNILVPQATLSPVQHLLSGHRPIESSQEDGLWEEHIQNQTLRSVVAVDARLCRKTASLQEILNLGVGDTILFDASPDQPIDLVCGDRIVARAKIGRSRERLAVKVVAAAGPADQAA